ncbi:MAG: LptE family protein [Bacteroidaceae bacterium]|nr:LptE family protein [Bacteroidaceae bacterium]
MDWKKNSIILSLCLALTCIVLIACKVEFSFNGASINYNEVKSISLTKFPIRCAYVWAPMEGMFYNSLSDAYAKKTKLKILKKNGDLQLTGEITEYSQTNKSISSDGFSAQTQLKMTVNVRFKNSAKPSADFEQSFSATTQYDSKQQLNAVQEQLVQEMINDIVDQIFNKTVADW